jgi:NADPH2:quinone reductase
MLAAHYERTGPADEVLAVDSVPDPVPGPGELRVRLRWSGVNPSDVKTRAGLRNAVLAFPRIIPHSDGMGVVDAVGAGVAPQRVGERVWLWNAAWGRADGTAAQFVVLPQDQAVALPEGVPDEAGACLGIPALTALHAVLAQGGVEDRQVLVAGGAGAVGHYAVQFARLLGARQVLTTVSSPAKAALATAAGASVVIDYRREDVAARVRETTGGRGVDRVIEVDIAANGGLDAELVRSGGDWMVYGSGQGQFSLPFFPLITKNQNLHFFIVYNLETAQRRRAETVLADLLRRGAVVHNIGERLPLAQVARAHQLVERGEVTGNVVLAIP